jgi:hypothetical protein
MDPVPHRVARRLRQGGRQRNRFKNLRRFEKVGLQHRVASAAPEAAAVGARTGPIDERGIIDWVFLTVGKIIAFFNTNFTCHLIIFNQKLIYSECNE